VRIANLGIISRKDHVREQGESRAETSCRAVHCGNNWLLDFQHVDDDLPRFNEECVELLGSHLLKPLDIAARAKGPAFAGQDDDFGFLILGDVSKEMGEFGV